MAAALKAQILAECAVPIIVSKRARKKSSATIASPPELPEIKGH